MSAIDAQLENLKSAVPAPSEPDCPDANIWREIAVALMPSDQALVHLQHASRCDHCGPLLRVAISDVDGNLTKSEKKKIAALESARPEWQQRLASRITGTPVPPAPLPWRKAWVSAPRLAFAALSLVAVIAAGSWFAINHARPTTPDDLLAAAYSEQRSFELRIAGADYAPVRVERGPQGSFLSRPAALLKAEALIASQFDSHHSDPNWLQAKARADLLEGKYDSAVEALRHALQIEPKSPSLLIDLGTAYFQRALMADSQEDFGAAYESLSQALAAQPDNSVALFNRAIIAEHQFLYHQALDDWNHYLRIDTGSEWASEARQRADDIRKKLKEHDQSHAAPLLTPSQIAAQANDPNLRAQVDQRVEEYLHEAVVSWLPHAFPENKGTPDAGAVQALFFLADLTAQQHGDRWLSDLLVGSSSTTFPYLVAVMSAAVKASDTGDYDTSAQRADVAETMFKTSSSPAGLLYAEFQKAYTAQLLRRGESCRSKAVSAETESEKYPYWWLQVQIGLEASVCSGLTNDLGAYDRQARRALERAQRAGYGALALRALNSVAGSESDAGDQSAASKLVNSGLATYWSGQYPAARGYNLYGNAADVAEIGDHPNLELAFLSESLILMTSDQNLLQRARIESETARVALLAEKPIVAQQHYAEAARLYALAPQNDLLRAYNLYNRILAAQAGSAPSQLDHALAELSSIEDEVRRLSDDFISEMYYATIGRVDLARHHYANAEPALRQALIFAEKDLKSLRTEEERTKWSKDAAPIYLGFVEASLAQARTQEALEVFEWYLGSGQRAGRAVGRSQSILSDLSRISSRLPLLSQQTVIAYGLLPGGLAIWTYDDRGMSAQWFPGKNNEILEIAAIVSDLASDPKSDLQTFHRNAHLLYELLVAPVEQHLDAGRTIVIETDESLSGIPFESLSDSTGRYLLERAPVVHSRGMYVDESLRATVPISADSPALVAASTASPPGSGLIPVPDIKLEADMVGGYFHNVHALRSPEVTLSRIKTELPAATVFHFAGHAIADSRDTGLVLDDRGSETQRPQLLDSDALRHLRPQQLQLTVLSACATANARTGDRSGLSSISEAFLRAGVPHVVASRWLVDSSQTRNFVSAFYRSLLSGSSVSEATRTTALKMLANPATAHPYYWSAFAAYGRP